MTPKQDQDKDSPNSPEKDASAKGAVKPRASRQQAKSASAEGKSSGTTARSKATSKPAAGKGASRKAPAAKTGRTKRPTAKESQAAPAAEAASLPRLQARLREEIAPALMKEFGYTSTMQVPRLSKIVLNIGLGEALDNARAIESATKDIATISGQRPVVTRARKSLAAFKLREGMAVGLSVTLHGKRMFEFLDRLVSSALPRIRDFNGLSREAFDGRGNYAIGIREQVIFPEIDYNSIDRIRGLQVVIVNTARTDREGFRLLESLGVPFARSITESRAA